MADQILQPGTPQVPEEDAYAAAARAMREEADANAQMQGTLAAYKATSSGLQPDRAAQVLQLSSARGVAPDEAAANFDNLNAAHQQDELAASLSGHPAIAEYMGQSDAHAALLKDDVPLLKMLGDGLQLGFVDIGTALEANRSSKRKLTPDEEQQLAFAEQVQAAGVPGATTLPRKIGAEVARATPTLALFGSAALSGAAVGGVVAGPPGAVIGSVLATAGAAYTIGFGPLYRRLKDLVTDDGQPLLDDDQAKAWASGGAALSAAIQSVPMTHFLKAVPGAGAALQKVGLDAAAQAAQSTVGRAALQRLAEYGGHVLAGGLAMAGQSAVNSATEELAKQQNGEEPDWGAVSAAAAEGFKTGLLLAPLAAFEPGRAFLSDVGRIRSARFEAARVDALAHVVKQLGILTRAPEEAEKVIGGMAGTGDARTVYVDLEHTSEATRSAIEIVVGSEAMAEAQAAKGDVAIPTETYLTRIAPEHQDTLRQDVKLSPDGYTLRQAEEQVAFHASRAHDIKQFQLAKIGTGTGLASEGYGLYFSNTEEVPRLYQEAHDALASGRIYRVSVPANELLLRYREKLSAQPEPVRAALEKAGLLGDGNTTGQDLYKDLKTRWQQGDKALRDTGAERADQAASRFLDALGIPGATYPAELSPGGKPASNFVIWREAAIRMNEPPKAPEPPSARALNDYATRMTESKRLGDLAPGRRAEAARRASDRLAELATEAARTGTEAARQGFLGAGAQAAGSEQTPAGGKENLREAGKKANRAEVALAEVPEFEQARDFNRALAKAEQAALDEAQKNRKFLLRYMQDETRGELGKAGDDYVAQVDRLLGGFELGQGASRTEVARRLATMEWISREQEAGRDPVIPDSVMAKLDRFVHWKEMTPQELRDLRSAVESIAHQAELKNTLLDRQERTSREQAKANLVASLRANTEAKPFRPTGSIVGNLEKTIDRLRGLKYGARAIERVINRLDGGDINGPWHRHVWDPISDSTQRWHDLVRQTTETIVKTIDEMPSAEMKRWRQTRFRVNGVDYDLSAAIAVALNSGNESNSSKLLRGWQDPSVEQHGLQSWTQDTPEQFLSKLTRRDWEFVQTVWDRLESMWPEAAKLEKRLTGLGPPKVAAKAFTRTFEDGSTIDLKGGYYPVIYDPDFSRTGKTQEEGAALRSVKLFDSSYYRAATPQGYLQKRVENFARPVLLSIDSLPHKISETAKDVAMREALISVHSVLTDNEISATLHTSELGRAGEAALLGWLRDTANDLVVPDNGSGQWLTLQNKTRAGYTASLFAYNLAQTAQNLTAIAPATRAVGPRWMTEALLRLAKERGSLVEWMDQQSGELRNRDRSGQPIAEAIQTLMEGKALTKDVMQFGLKFFQSTDTAVVYPTWLAAYMKGSTAKESGGLGFDHDTAVRHANATVRLNVMANSTKDLPAILRNKVGRWMLPLYSYSLHRLNLIGDAIGLAHDALRQRSVAKAAGILGGVWGALAMEAVVSEVVKGNGPGDENGDGTVDAADIAIWTAKISATAPLTWIPIIGQAARAVATGRDPLGTPEMSVMTAIGRGVRDTGKLVYQALAPDETVDDELVTRTAMHLLEAGGYVGAALGGGLPVSQARATAGYFLDEESPKDNPLQIGLGTAFGKKRPGKLLSLTE